MPKPGQTAPFTFFHSLPPADQERLRRVGDWRWVASSGRELAAPVRHPAHQKWIATKANVHAPAHREIMLVLHGGGVFGFGGKVYRRAPGTVFLFDHYETRDWAPCPHNRVESSVLWLHLLHARDSLTYNTVSRDGNGRTYREITRRIHSGDAVRLLTETWDRCKAEPGEAMHWELLKSLVTATLLEVLWTARPKPHPRHHEQVVDLACQYVADHLAEDLTLDFLARMAGYSPFFFHRLFREQTGKTPREYVDGARLERARELLRQGYTLTAVSQSIGLSTPYSFSRFFKERSGFSPKAWRALHCPAPKG